MRIVPNVRHRLRFGSIGRPGWVCACDGSVFGGKIMDEITRQLELLLLGQMSNEELARVLVGLIQSSPGLRKAILSVVGACPNIVTKG
jgi:hypothetical protein